MLEIGLGGGYAPLLKHKKVFVDLLLIELSRDFSIMQCNGCHVHRVVFESTWTAAKYRNTTLKTVD